MRMNDIRSELPDHGAEPKEKPRADRRIGQVAENANPLQTHTVNGFPYAGRRRVCLMGEDIHIMPLFDLGIGQIRHKIFNPARNRGVKFR